MSAELTAILAALAAKPINDTIVDLIKNLTPEAEGLVREKFAALIKAEVEGPHIQNTIRLLVEKEVKSIVNSLTLSTYREKIDEAINNVIEKHGVDTAETAMRGWATTIAQKKVKEIVDDLARKLSISI